MTEQPVLVGTERNLVGIITAPDAGVTPNGLGAIFLNAGVVHRVGPNRLYVNGARALAKLGFVSVRFDLPGIGDSPARRDAKPFEQAAVEETVQVMSDLEQRCGVRRFVLVGLCSGAVVSFNGALADPRVVGTVLLNPQGFGGSHEFISYVVGRGRMRRYVEKLFSATSWRRLLTGQSDYGHWRAALASLPQSVRRPHAAVTEFSRDLAGNFRGLADRGVRVLLACSGGDYSLDYLEVIMGPEFKRLDRHALQSTTLPSGDHSLTLWRSQQMFLETVESWALTLAEAERRAPHIASSPELPHQMARASAGGGSR